MCKRLVGLVCILLALSACESKSDKSMGAQQGNEPQENAAAVKTPQKPAPAKSELEKARANTGLFAMLPAQFDDDKHPTTPAMVELGRKLYYDTRLSKNHDISCNSCHKLDAFGVDNEPTSPGHKGQRGGRNSPTVYNAAGHIAQFWDGRAADVEEQAAGPITNPIEMAMADAAAVDKVLLSIPGYAQDFKKAFPSQDAPVNYKNAAVAIAAFERGLMTPGRWDKFLGGDDKALTEQELAGFNTFMEVGCGACHNGPTVGGKSYQKVGAVKPWPNQQDLGRFEVTKKDEDKMVFKAPSLRNIEKTAPYFHDGKTGELSEAVRLMGRHQLGRELEDADVEAIVLWLKSLTGQVPVKYIAKPELPESSPNTPKPDPS